MASLIRDANGRKRIQFVDGSGRRRTIRLGALPVKSAETFKTRIEAMNAARISGTPIGSDLAGWLRDLPGGMHDRLARVGLVEPRVTTAPVTIGELLDRFMGTATVKATTKDAYRQTTASLLQFLGADIPVRDLTPEHANAVGFANAAVTARAVVVRASRRDRRAADLEGRSIARRRFETARHVPHAGSLPRGTRDEAPGLTEPPAAEPLGTDHPKSNLLSVLLSVGFGKFPSGSAVVTWQLRWTVQTRTNGMNTRRLAIAASLCLTTASSADPILWLADSAQQLGCVDLATGEVLHVVSIGDVIVDIAFDPNGTLYGLTFLDLYTINPNNGLLTLIGPHGVQGGNALVFGTNGTLYAAGGLGVNLYTLDPATGLGTVVGDIGFMSAGDLTINGGELYMSSTTAELVQIDLVTGAGTAVGNIGFDPVWGLATDNGTTYGVTATSILTIDIVTGAGSVLLDYGGQGLFEAYGSAFFGESIAGDVSVYLGPPGGRWSVPGFWSLGLVPDATTIAIVPSPMRINIDAIAEQLWITAGGSTTVEFDATLFVQGLDIDTQATLAVELAMPPRAGFSPIVVDGTGVLRGLLEIYARFPQPCDRYNILAAGAINGGFDAFELIGGSGVVATLIEEDDTLLLEFTTAPTVCEFPPLFASTGGTDDAFGYAVALDGSVAIVGAPQDDDNGSNSGSANIFRFNGITWSEEAMLTASDGAANDLFGGSVAIDDTLAIVGARGTDDNGPSSGSAYIFRFNDVTWVEESKLTASDGEAGDLFGGSVAIAADVAIVGAEEDNDNGPSSGSAYIFRFNGVTWVEESKLTASDGSTSDRFGSAVTIDGPVAIVGAAFDDASGGAEGSAYIFRFDGATWVQEQKLTNNLGGRFGSAVAVHGDLAIVGGPGGPAGTGSDCCSSSFDPGCSNTECMDLVCAKDPFCCATQWDANCANQALAICDVCVPSSLAGPAFIYRFDGVEWVEEQMLLADGAGDDSFGSAVAIGGELALIGAVGDDESGMDAGAVFVYRFDGINWIEAGKLTGSAAGNLFGGAVGIGGGNGSSDRTLIVGASGTMEGSARIMGGLDGVDCDCDGVSDACALLFDFSEDANGDLVPDECQCLGDLDGSGDVGINDFLDLLAAWGPNPGHPADFDGDNVVGINDFLALLANWGGCP